MKQHLHLIAIPLAKLALHLGTYRGYGMFRDEFYYLACADRLAFGYVDHPPFSVMVLAVVKAVLGDSLLAVRLVPALAGAATVLVSGLIARRLGGGRGAQSLAMLATLVAPIYLALNHFYSMNAIDILLWAVAGLILVELLERDAQTDSRRWALLGLVLGIGLLNKISVLWLGAGLLVGLVATDRRRLLLQRGPWIAAGIAALLFLPHLVWQFVNDWPTLEFIRNASNGKMVTVTPLAFVKSQARMMNMATLPLWVGGLVWLLRDGSQRGHRMLGVIYLTVFLLLILNGTSRAGYLGPAYTWLLPAGAVAFERLLGLHRGVPLALYAAVLLVAGAAFAPFGLPLLPVDQYIRYAAAMGVGPNTEERKELAELPQFYADMHGWESIVDTVAEVYESLPSEDREAAAIFTFNYGDAGAIEYFGRSRGLPVAIAGHNNYWLWGPPSPDPRVVLVVGDDRESVEASFSDVEPGAVIDCGRCMPYENNRTVWIARGLRRSMAEAWPRAKHYD